MFWHLCDHLPEDAALPEGLMIKPEGVGCMGESGS